jgi:hypothetical protein
VGKAMDKYNRDEPQGGAASSIELFFGVVVGCLLSGSLCFSVAMFLSSRAADPSVVFTLLLVVPLVAVLGGIVGALLSWKRPKEP